MRIFVYLIIGAVLFVLYVMLLESRAVFLPSVGYSTAKPSDLRLAYEDVYFSTSDNVKLHGWFVPAKNNSQEAVTFLFFHGNAGNIGNRVDKVEMFHDLGVNLFIIDYRGYGFSEGKPSEKGIYLDAQAAFDYLQGRADIRHDRIISIGESLGGAAAVDLAVNRPVAGLIMQSTFTSGKEMAKRILPIVPLFLVRTQMNSIAKIAQVKVPKLVIHSTEDEMIPFEMGQRLFEAGPEPKQFLALKGSHNEGHFFYADIYIKGMRAFLGKYFNDGI